MTNLPIVDMRDLYARAQQIRATKCTAEEYNEPMTRTYNLFTLTESREICRLNYWYFVKLLNYWHFVKLYHKPEFFSDGKRWCKLLNHENPNYKVILLGMYYSHDCELDGKGACYIYHRLSADLQYCLLECENIKPLNISRVNDLLNYYWVRWALENEKSLTHSCFMQKADELRSMRRETKRTIHKLEQNKTGIIESSSTLEYIPSQYHHSESALFDSLMPISQSYTVSAERMQWVMEPDNPDPIKMRL